MISILKEKKKLKVLWICGFSNLQLNNILKPWKKANESAPWITNLIKLFENQNEIELHVVFKYSHIAFSKNFILNGVYYHAVRIGLPLWGGNGFKNFRIDYYSDQYFWKYKTRLIVNKLRPDIIHLHGFENEFAQTILQFEDEFPVFITIQGYIGKSTVSNKFIEYRKKIEAKIIGSFNYYGIRTKTMETDIKTLNSKAKTYWHQYPFVQIEPLNKGKIYDIVFFARVTKDKGIGDLLEALSKLRDVGKIYSLLVIGNGQLEFYKELASRLNISNQIIWAGFLETQQQVHELVSQSSITVLPTYHDMIPGTIIESLFLKIPVIAYDVGSIHELNSQHNIVELVEKFNIEELAKKIDLFLVNSNLRKERSELGYEKIKSKFSSKITEERNNLIEIYENVIQGFNFKK